MEVLWDKLKEVADSVLPIAGLILLWHWTWAPLSDDMLIRCAIGTLLVIVGLAIFHVGVEIGIVPIGTHLGHAMTRYGKIAVVAVSGLVVGLAIATAEPNLRIYGAQVESMTGGLITEMTLVYLVAAGVAALLGIGLYRIVRSVPLKYILVGTYALVALCSLLVPTEFIAISFDASGAVTGAMTVPFLLALAAGVAQFKSADSVASEEDSFGLVGLVSAGAFLGVLLMVLVTGQGSFLDQVQVTDITASAGMWETIRDLLPQTMVDVLLSILPIVVLFYLAYRYALAAHRSEVRRINAGLIYTYIGLVIFMLGVNFGFNQAGYEIGAQLGELGSPGILVGSGLVLGLVVILAEPAVTPLIHQIEDMTGGYVPGRLVLISLSLAVGGAVALSMLRMVISGLSLWHILLVGYGIALTLSFVVPPLFVGMAFDSGSVASGPMAATFVLSFAGGAARHYPGADVFLDGLGVIAVITVVPIVVLQLLGLLFKIKARRKSS